MSSTTTTVVEALNTKLTTLQQVASDAYSQYRNPRDVPITLSFAIDLVGMTLALAVQVEELKAQLEERLSE